MEYLRPDHNDGRVHFLCTRCAWATWTFGVKTYDVCPDCGSRLLTDSEDLSEVFTDLSKYQKELEYCEKIAEEDADDRFGDYPLSGVRDSEA